MVDRVNKTGFGSRISGQAGTHRSDNAAAVSPAFGVSPFAAVGAMAGKTMATLQQRMPVFGPSSGARALSFLSNPDAARLCFGLQQDSRKLTNAPQATLMFSRAPR
ncbi:MAG: hypothetical protein AB7P76_12400 [Candidatus Melainabacteria bacterium]